MRKVLGAPVSPFVRKVLLVLESKGLEYELDPVTPMNLPPDYDRMSPLNKIPAYSDGELNIADSSVICQYLEEQYPQPSVYPSDLADRARARWFEEYADTKMIEVFGPPLFLERVLKPQLLNEETDEQRVQDNIDNNIPPVLDYLESQAPEAGFLCGPQLTIADFAVIGPIINAQIAQYEVDDKRWPQLAAYIERVKAEPAVAQRLQKESETMAQLMASMQAA